MLCWYLYLNYYYLNNLFEDFSYNLDQNLRNIYISTDYFLSSESGGKVLYHEKKSVQ